MWSTTELAARIRAKDITAVEAVDEALQRIDELNESLNAFIHLAPDAARDAAAAVDKAIARGEAVGPLAGVPFGIKDMDHCAGMPTTYGSLMFKDAAPSEKDSVHIGRLRAAGAIPVGMTTAPEFGTVAYTRSRAWGVTRNPWNLEHTPGGSSGGSAAAVAAGLVPFATAGDGGGSTRIPGAFTGLVGFKPSYGRIPREGANTSQTAVWGAMVTTVEDAALHLDVVAGPDDRDRTSLPAPTCRYGEAIETLDIDGLRVAWSPDLGYAVVDSEVRAMCESAAEALVDAARLTPVDYTPRLDDPVRTWLGVGAIDIWLYMERGDWPEKGELLVPGVRKSYEDTFALPLPWYSSILKRRTKLEENVAEIFDNVDVLLTPTTAVPAFGAAGPPPTEINGTEVHAAMAVPFTMPANICWNPAISVPAGLTESGLPVGLQIMGRRHADDVVLRLARIFEQARPWQRLAQLAAQAA